jgi:nucleoside-diphosphate-sugar epimerase
MTRVVVTGGSGKAGRACIRDLLAHGYEVANADLVPPAEPLCPFSRVDLTDFGQAVEALSMIDNRVKGVDAVVHLAAIRAPGLYPNAVTFATNTVSTYNVFEAARRLGVANVVWASSETVLGLPFDTPPPTRQWTRPIRGGRRAPTRCPSSWARRWPSSSAAGIRGSRSSASGSRT